MPERGGQRRALKMRYFVRSAIALVPLDTVRSTFPLGLANRWVHWFGHTWSLSGSLYRSKKYIIHSGESRKPSDSSIWIQSQLLSTCLKWSQVSARMAKGAMIGLKFRPQPAEPAKHCMLLTRLWGLNQIGRTSFLWSRAAKKRWQTTRGRKLESFWKPLLLTNLHFYYEKWDDLVQTAPRPVHPRALQSHVQPRESFGGPDALRCWKGRWTILALGFGCWGLEVVSCQLGFSAFWVSHLANRAPKGASTLESLATLRQLWSSPATATGWP